jgi:hypothetical protein
MILIYLIYCAKCQVDTGLATSNLNILAEIPYTCPKCEHKGKGTDNYHSIDREKYLEDYEELENNKSKK